LHGLYKKLETRDHELLYLFLELTRKCNLTCLHCGSDCTANELNGHLDLDQWLAIVDYCKDRFSPELTFVFTGGEPLLFPGIATLGRKVVENGMRWSLVTNGMLLHQKTLNKLVQAGVYGLTISLDGLEGSHNRLLGSTAAFRKALSAIEIAGESGIPVTDVVTCVFPDNRMELDSVAELLIERNIPNWRLFRIFPSGRAKKNDELLLSFSQTREVIGWIKENKKRLARRGLTVNASCEGFLHFEEDRLVRDTPYFCRSGISIASVLVDGTITGCPNNDPEFYEGNVLRDELWEVWDQGFGRFRDREWSRKGVCGDCGYFKECLGNSLHLWHEGADRPAFCYEKDFSRL